MFIYKITNTQTQEFYIGQTIKNIEYRFRKHKEMSIRGGGYKLHNAMRKYGVENFIIEILDTATNLNELNEKDALQLIANGDLCVTDAANMPCTLDAIKQFLDAKVLFAPGKAANARGVAASGLEMTQNSIRLNWTSEEVDARLKDIMVGIHSQCKKYGTEEDGYVNYVKGANIAGFVKVADSMLDQGVV